eukprot:gene3673-4019_t
MQSILVTFLLILSFIGQLEAFVPLGFRETRPWTRALLARSGTSPIPQPSVKDLLLADTCSGLSRAEINELVLQLEKRNPTYEPAYSPLLNGVWEIVSASIFSPGLIGYQAMKTIPSGILNVEDLTITISSVKPRVKAATKIKIANMHVEVSVTTDLQPETGIRLTESYESGKLGPFELPLTTVKTFSRELLVSYLDEDLLIVRDALGTPEILRRKEMPPRITGNSDNLADGAPAV